MSTQTTRKARFSHETSDGKPQIPRNGIEKRKHALVVPALGDNVRAAKRQDGRSTSRGRAQAASHVVLDEQLEVGLELGGELFGRRVPPLRGADARIDGHVSRRFS